MSATFIATFSALHLGRRRGKQFAYVGKAGTGFTQKTARELRQLLDVLESRMFAGAR